MKKSIKKSLLLTTKSFSLLNSNYIIEKIYVSTNLILKSLKSGKKIIFCGNGGSASDSQHLSAELVGRYLKARKAIASIALTTDTSAITSIGNDMGFENIFSRQIEAIGNEGDVLFLLSTSGQSKNILKAIEIANKKKIKTIFLTSELLKNNRIKCDVIIKSPAYRVDRIQEMHIAIGHIICEAIENNIE
jgi:D-sedoheptulose 7-phosphate isomerase